MWAPDGIRKDGKYYYYFPAAPQGGSAFRRIGVGVSDSPEGPFAWEPGYIKGVSGIDPGLFVDDDNKAYLLFGGGQPLFVSPLIDNMKEIAADPILIEHLPEGYKEGSFMFKRGGIYYMTFAHVFPQEGCTIGYATGESPRGPFTYRGKIMDNIANGTNHHSIGQYNGQWILFCHWWDISGFNKLRSMRAEYMQFNEDGTIKKVVPTLRGIGTPGVGETIQVDRNNEFKGAEIAFVNGGEPDGWSARQSPMHMSAMTGLTFPILVKFRRAWLPDKPMAHLKFGWIINGGNLLQNFLFTTPADGACGNPSKPKSRNRLTASITWLFSSNPTGALI